MNKSLFPAITAAVLLLSSGWASSQTLTTPENSPGLGKSHFVSFGTNKIHYLTGGKGSQTILFVHGWACNSGFWREQVQALADKARLILIDLPGHGQSGKPQADYTPG